MRRYSSFRWDRQPHHLQIAQFEQGRCTEAAGWNQRTDIGRLTGERVWNGDGLTRRQQRGVVIPAAHYNRAQRTGASPVRFFILEAM
jgi:hypothetical protein